MHYKFVRRERSADRADFRGGFKLPQFLYDVIWDNTVWRYLLFLASVIVCFIIVGILGHFVFKRLSIYMQKKKSSSDDLLVKNIKRYVMPAAYFAAFYLNMKILTIGPRLSEIVDLAVLAFTTVMAALFVSSLIVLLFNKYWENKRKDANKELAVKTISGLLKVIVWAIAVILFLDNIGVKINTLIAGVGISGIAVAFAAQSILGDIFCFFTIFFDRPFEMGDFIVAGEQMGTVEYIGLKTTRLRALSGEQLIFSNTDLTNSRIQNFKTMAQRRVLFTLDVTYDTPVEKLRDIPSLIKNIIESTPDTTFSRAHFVSFEGSSLKFEIAYYILSGDYDKYMDIHQDINLRIKDFFEKSGIKFAFPTQTLHLHASSTGENPVTLS